MSIDGAADEAQVAIQANESGYGTLNLTVSREQNGETVSRTASMQIKVDAITSIDAYVTATEAGRAPILPKTVVANGIAFDDPTPDLMGNNGLISARNLTPNLFLLSGEDVDPELYAEDKVEQP